jgi:hypothetical protein
MIVWITHVKVGHRQTPILKTPSSYLVGVFYCEMKLMWKLVIAYKTELFKV